MGGLQQLEVYEKCKVYYDLLLNYIIQFITPYVIKIDANMHTELLEHIEVIAVFLSVFCLVILGSIIYNITKDILKMIISLGILFVFAYILMQVM